MSVSTRDDGSGTLSSACFIIELYDSDFYVSEPFGEGDQSFTDPSTVSWFEYDPTVDFSDVAGAAAPLTPTGFQNLTAGGVYVRATSSGRLVQRGTTGFEINAADIPEPTTAALLLAPLMLSGRRRRK